MRRALSFLAITALLVSACGSNPAEPTSESPATLNLAVGQQANAGSLLVKFIGVTSDSRCPIDAICIQNGDALLQVELSLKSDRATQELQVAHPDARRSSFRGYIIEVEELLPYPAGQRRIDPKEYRVRLRVRR